ncbi:MAG: recombinase family protein [Steroidobacteraceae bacterium]
MKYGYARVSREDQIPALQLAALKKAGCKTVFKDEGISGATAQRPARLKCLKTLEAGDTLVVWKLDRLERSRRDLIHLLDELKHRGVKFRSLTEAIDTDTATGRAMWPMIGVLAELERSLIVERTRAGVKAAQRRGLKFGRKPKLSAPQIAHARQLIEGGQRVQDVAALLSVGRVTLYRALQRVRMCCVGRAASSAICDSTHSVKLSALTGSSRTSRSIWALIRADRSPPGSLAGAERYTARWRKTIRPPRNVTRSRCGFP